MTEEDLVNCDPGRAAARLVEDVLAALPDGVLVYDAGGRVLLANYKAAILLGVPWGELQAGGWEILRLEERAELETKIARVLAAASPEVWEGPFPMRDGGVRWLRFRLSGLERENARLLLLAISDVSSHRRAEKALRLTHTSVDRCTDPIYWLGPDGRILFANETGCRRYGYSREEMLSLTVFQIAPGLTSGLWVTRWNETKRAKSLVFETLHVTKAGEVFPVEIRSNYVAHEGEEYVVAFARDISERKRQERELQEAKQAAEATNAMLRQAVRRAHRLNQQLRAAHKELEERAATDSLTGTLTRRAVLDRLHEELARSERTGVPCGVGLIDVDRFKQLNDCYGHLAGDQALSLVADRIAASLRPYDVIGRYGGEEFLILMPGADAEEVRTILERVRQAVAASPVEVEGHQLQLTVSAGGVSGRRDLAEDLIRAADEALYQAKRSRRNRVVMAAGARPAAGCRVPNVRQTGRRHSSDIAT